MPLGKEVGHGPAGHIVLDWDQLPPWKSAQQPPLARFTGEACVRKQRPISMVIRQGKRRRKKIETTAAKYNGLPYSKACIDNRKKTC